MGSGWRKADLPSAVQSLNAFRAADTAEAQALIAGDLQCPMGLAGRHGEGSARLEGNRPTDGTAGSAHEPEHAVASRGFQER